MKRSKIVAVLEAHRIVGVSGLGIEEVACSCETDFWAGRMTWHPASWHPGHVADEIRKASR